jgi:ankyrin repeat protein
MLGYKDVNALMLACIEDKYEEVVYQIEVLKVNPNIQRRTGHTALIDAICNKNYKIAVYLCEKGADKNVKDTLLYAISRCPEIAMYLIMNGVDVNSRNDICESPMHFAAAKGNLTIMKMLYERGSEINVYNHKRHSPLMVACASKHLNCVKYLISNGANINDQHIYRDNLLHECIFNNSYDILLYLLNNRNMKLINSSNMENESSLMYAVKEEKIEFVKLLLKYGADTHTCNRNNETPLIYAVKKNNYELTELLLKYGANPNTYFTGFNNYSSPLYFAIKNNNDDLITLLLNHKANDLMHILIEVDNYTEFRKLLTKDNVNRKNNNDATLLYFAVCRNRIEYVKLLLKMGANTNICCELEQNKSPLYQSIISRNYEMFRLLIKYYANYNHKIKNNESIRGKASRYCYHSKIYDDLKNLNAIESCEWD